MIFLSVINCGDPKKHLKAVEVSRINGTDFLYGAYYSVNCLFGSTGLTEFGDTSTIRCEEDGYWNLGTLLCQGQ